MLSENQYTIRKAQLSDICDIMELEHLGFEDEIREPEEVFRDRINHFAEGFYLLEQSKKVIGYMSTELWNQVECLDYSSFRLGHSMMDFHTQDGINLYISSLVIHPNYRNLGLAKRLMDTTLQQVLSQYSRVQRITLLVNETWIKAQRIYEAQGFQVIGKVPHFFFYRKGMPHDGIIMTKIIENAIGILTSTTL